MKRIDTRKSTIYTGNIGSISSCLDAGCLGAKGYFTNVGDCMCDTDIQEGTLKKVIADKHFNNPYVSDVSPLGYKFFIPFDELVFIEEQPAKKYRPYKDFAEFVNHMGLQDFDKVQFIKFKSKSCPSRYNLAYTGYEEDRFGVVYIHLGSLAFTLYELFKDYEYELNSFEWVPFGVEEDEENE